MRLQILLAALVVAASCGPEAPETMDRGSFIDVMIELRQAELDTSDAEEFAARRDEILAGAGVTDSMLVAFARIHGPDADYMAAVWDSIDAVVNEVQLDDELQPDTAGPG